MAGEVDGLERKVALSATFFCSTVGVLVLATLDAHYHHTSPITHIPHIINTQQRFLCFLSVSCPTPLLHHAVGSGSTCDSLSEQTSADDSALHSRSHSQWTRPFSLPPPSALPPPPSSA